MNEIAPQDPFRPMLAQSSINAGAVAIESERAIAEARGKIQVAKMFPRSMAQAMAEFMDACKSPDFANTAFYAVPNRGSGPSIRFMEEAARCYGNMQYGHRELSRSDGKSEVEVFAWDVERNNESKRQVTVLHIVVLATDKYAGVGWWGSFVPMGATYRPLPVTLGVIGLYAGLAAGITAAVKARFPQVRSPKQR